LVEEEKGSHWAKPSQKRFTQVYCGECARNRFKSKRNGKAPAHAKVQPFDKCKVEGCARSVKAASSMVQIFL